MQTAAGLAKRCGLEHYLDKPAELNDAIFNLLLLQETIQMEQAQRMRRDEPGAASIAIQRTAYGTFTAACAGDGRYRYAVETALRSGTTVIALFQRSRFVSVLRSMGIPEDAIAGYCSSVRISDDTTCIDRE